MDNVLNYKDFWPGKHYFYFYYDVIKANFVHTIFFKKDVKIKFNLLSSFRITLDWLLFQLTIKIQAFIFSRICSKSDYSRICSINIWCSTKKTLQYLVLREQFLLNFHNRGVIETLKMSVISSCKFFLLKSHIFFVTTT